MRASSLGSMGYVGSNLAREISRLYGWKDKVWSRRYQAIVVSGEEKAQIARFNIFSRTVAKRD